MKYLVYALLMLVSLNAYGAPKFVVKGKLINKKTSAPIENGKIAIISERYLFVNEKKKEKNTISVISNKEGFEFENLRFTKSKKGAPYQITVEVPGYKKLQKIYFFYYSKKGFHQIPDIKLEPKAIQADITGIILSKRTKKPISNVKIKLADKTYETNSKGEFKILASQQLVDTPFEILLEASAFGYKTKTSKMTFVMAADTKKTLTFKTVHLESDMVPLVFSGKVSDFFGGASTKEAKVTINDKGELSIKGLNVDFEVPSDYKIKVTKKGYHSEDFMVKTVYKNKGSIQLKKVLLKHIDLPPAKVTFPKKTVYDLRPSFTWAIDKTTAKNIQAITFALSKDKTFKKAKTYTLKKSDRKILFSDLKIKRLEDTTTYFVKVIYKMNRGQISKADVYPFETAAMQFSRAPVQSTPITTQSSNDLNPSWSPNGKTIYFSSNKSNDAIQVYEIWSKEIGKVGIQKITSSYSNSVDYIPLHGPGPNQLTYISKRVNSEIIWSVSLGKANMLPAQVIHQSEGPIKWITCGGNENTILFCKKKIKQKAGVTDMEIWLKTDISKSLLQVQGSQINLSTSGKNLVYVSDALGTKDIFLYSLSDGTQVNLLTDRGYDETDPSWTNDGEGIVYSTNKNGNYDLWYYRKRTGKSIPLTNSLADERFPSCNPVNNKVVYCTDASGVMKLHTLELPELE